jgi:Tol biopolymer transport system component
MQLRHVVLVLLASTAALPASASAHGGSRIAFTSFSTGAGDIYTMKDDGRDVRRVTEDPAADAQPDWAPDGRRIAYRSRSTGQYEIYTVSAKGGMPQRITTAGPAYYSTQPSWTADGRDFVFRSNRPPSEKSDVWRMGVDGSDARLVAALPDHQLYPSLSRDGTRYLFTTGPTAGDAYDDRGLFTFGDAGLSTLLDNPVAYDSAPAWSPDNSQIAFESDVDGDMEVFVMNADGTNVRQLTFNDVHDEGPSWSPDSRRLAFTSERDDPLGDIYTMRTDGSDVRRLTFTPTKEESPDWGPSPRR